MRRKRRLFLWAVLSVLLAACGGGGGGDPQPTPPPPPPPPSVIGNGFASETGPGDTGDYFPNAIGNRWMLDYTETETAVQPINGELSVSVVGVTTIAGKTASVLRQVNSAGGIGSSDHYYYISGGGITYLGNNDPADVLTAQTVPYVRLRFPVATGNVSSLTATNLVVGSDGNGNPLTLDMTQQITNTGFEDVNVIAGAFPGALKQTTTITGVVKSQASNTTVGVSGTETRWFVPHVGVVKETTSTTIDTQTLTTNAEVKGYVINGVARGLGSPFTAVSGLSPGDGNPNPPRGRPAVGTDGTTFMLITRRASGVSPAYTTEWLATRVRLNGTADPSTPISPATAVANPLSAERAAIAFDGTNYLVVYEKDNNFASTGNHPSLIAQRLSAAGALVGTASEVASPGTNSPALAFDGTNYLLVYSRSNAYGDFGQLMGVFVSPATGQAGAEFPITAQGYQLNPALAFDGTNYLVVWDQWAWLAQAPGVYAAQVTKLNGTVTSAFAVSATSIPSLEHLPVVLFDGAHHVVLWRSFQPDNLHANLKAMRVSISGQLIDGAGFAVTTGSNNIIGLLTLASVGGNVFAAWNGDCSLGCGIYGARVSTPANAATPMSVIGTPGFKITAGGPFPRLAATPAGALLTWLDGIAAPVIAVSAMPIFPFGP
jgi:hypothetical protein